MQKMPNSELSIIEVGLCSICGDRADGYHYGVLSCRGCNAFFRRAVAFNLQFHCRRDGQCDINKNARCACRACRLQKCHNVGMDPSAVQVRREVKETLGLDHQQERNDFSFGFDRAQSSMATIFSMSVFGSAKMLNSFKLKSHLLGSMTSSVANSPLVMHPLDRLIEWYFCQRYRRSSMLCQTVEQILNFGSINCPQETRLTGQATPEELSHVNKVEMVLMFEWVEQLEEFEHELENAIHKTQLLRGFAMKYLLLDTILYGLEEGFNDRIVFANGTYIHPNNCFRRISPPFGSNEDEMRRLTAVSMMNDEGFVSMIEELIQPLIDMEITFGEFMTLRLLLFWEPENADDSPKGEIIKNASTKALNNLQSWYELHSVGGTQRLENLLLFVPLIKKYADYLTEIAGHIPDFAQMPEWQFISDLVIA